MLVTTIQHQSASWKTQFPGIRSSPGNRELPKELQDLYGVKGGALVESADPNAPAGKAPGAEGRNMDHLCLRADPFDRAAIVAHLEAHGVRVGDFGSRYGAEGEGPSQYLFDPEDNLVELKGPPAGDDA